MNVGDIITEPIWLHNLAGGEEKRERVADLMRTVGLLPTHTDQYPHEFPAATASALPRRLRAI